MSKTIRDCLLLTVYCLLLTVLIWLPHLLALPNLFGLDFSKGFNIIYRNFDGLDYVVIAKSFYQPGWLATVPQNYPASYYASHFPGYSLVIWGLAPLFGYLKSMLLSSLLFTLLSTITFYFFIRDFQLTKHPLILSVLFLILPARWLVVHSVGSSEPMFIFFILLSIYGFMRFEKQSQTKWIWLTAAGGVGAQLTRPPGILLVVALSLYIHTKVYLNFKRIGLKAAVLDHLKYWPLVFIPLTLIAVFAYFQFALGDFAAYFHSGDNIHLTFPPFKVFNKNQFWVGEIWLEDIIYIFILGLLAGITLLKQRLYPMGFFALTYLISIFFVAHRDIARYSLPIFPFLLIAFEKVLVSKEFRLVIIILALAIYLYAQNFLLYNIAPIPNLDLFN